MNMCQHRMLVKLSCLRDLKPADLSRFRSVRDDNCLNGIHFEGCNRHTADAIRGGAGCDRLVLTSHEAVQTLDGP